jgi:predicted aspartyl protease
MRMQLANNDDLVGVRLGVRTPAEVRRFEVDGIVDSGAAHVVLPQAAMDALGLPESWRAKTRYADGSTKERPVIKNVSITLCGRESVFSAVIEPGRTDALIGAIVMEELDLIVDCVTGQLLPRDPQIMTTVLDGYDEITIIGPAEASN